MTDRFDIPFAVGPVLFLVDWLSQFVRLMETIAVFAFWAFWWTSIPW